MDNTDNTAQGVLLFAALIYFAPAVVASMRGHMSATAIFVLNLFLGWTALGWILALVWSFTGNTKANARMMSGLPPKPKPLDWLVGYKPKQHYVRIGRVDPIAQDAVEAKISPPERREPRF